MHENINIANLISLKELHPDAEIIVHPECPPAVRHLANFIGGTAQMSRYVSRSFLKEFIVGTEVNFAYRLKKDNSNKIFYPVDTICNGMNEITLEKVKFALENIKYTVTIPLKIRRKAREALNKMLEF